MAKSTILVTGAGGQIGTELVLALQKEYGTAQVIATDLKPLETGGPTEILDVTDTQLLAQLIDKYQVTQIYHLAALLSSKGEKNIALTWKLNFDAYKDILELAVEKKIQRLFFPSTIGIYGPSTPKQNTPQQSSFEPTTIYGMSKLTGELWSSYYRNRYKLDVRSLRFPGVISYQVLPVGGTTDFAVEIFFAAKKEGHYSCYLKEDTRLPMIYMPDVINATLQLMSAPMQSISTAVGYNLSGFSLTPAEVYAEIKKHLPEMTIVYRPDARQSIADSWTETIDDSLAKADWGWAPRYDMSSMTVDMLKNL